MCGMLLLLVAAPVPAGAAHSTPHASGPGAKKVALRFAWPTRVEAAVEHRGVRIEPDAPAQIALGPFSCRMLATTSGEEVRVVFRGWSGGSGSDPDGVAMLQAAEPIVVVLARASGAFVRTEGTDAAAEAMNRIPAVQKLPEHKREWMVRNVPARTEQDWRDIWLEVVSVWAGKDLELGRDYVLQREVPVPVVPGEKLRVEILMRAERIVDCPGSDRTSCVELRYRGIPDAKDADRIVEAYVTKVGIPTPPPALRRFVGTSTDVFAVTEIDRLLPHRFAIEHATRVSDGGVEKVWRTQRTWTFHYAGAPAGR
jgi:hypothetical protein